MAPSRSRAGSAREGLAVNLNACKYDVLRDVADDMGITVAGPDDEDWDLLWTDLSVTIESVQKLRAFQRLNHFPGMLEICRKASLSRNFRRISTRLPHEFSFLPKSLVLPDQLEEFVATLKRNKSKVETTMEPPPTYILKPTSGCMGKGISLVQTVEQVQVADVANVVAQLYISKPLLIDNFKFDLRLYALVLSVDPLKIYLYDEGLARFATEPYQTPQSTNLHATSMHLTNYAITKESVGFVSSDPLGRQGTKRFASVVLQQVADKHGVSKSQLVNSISAVIVKTVLCIQPMLAHTYHTALSASFHGTSHSNRGPPCSCLSLDHQGEASCTAPPSQCFEVLGFDVMLDHQLHPWLIEVNHSPSFATESTIDKQLKQALLKDTVRALNMRPETRQHYYEEQSRQLNERLYSSPNKVRKRALSAQTGGNHSNLQHVKSAASAMEEIHKTASSMLAGSGAKRQVHSASACTKRGDNGCGGGGGECGDVYHGGHQASSKAGWEEDAIPGSIGFMEPGDSWDLNHQLGRYFQIYPARTEANRKRYAKILQTAADLYPDQRCQCHWCARHQFLRHCPAAAMNMIHRSTNLEWASSNETSSTARLLPPSASSADPSNVCAASPKSADQVEAGSGTAVSNIPACSLSASSGGVGGQEEGAVSKRSERPPTWIRQQSELRPSSGNKTASERSNTVMRLISLTRTTVRTPSHLKKYQAIQEAKVQVEEEEEGEGGTTRGSASAVQGPLSTLPSNLRLQGLSEEEEEKGDLNAEEIQARADAVVEQAVNSDANLAKLIKSLSFGGLAASAASFGTPTSSESAEIILAAANRAAASAAAVLAAMNAAGVDEVARSKDSEAHGALSPRSRATDALAPVVSPNRWASSPLSSPRGNGTPQPSPPGPSPSPYAPAPISRDTQTAQTPARPMTPSRALSSSPGTASSTPTPSGSTAHSGGRPLTPSQVNHRRAPTGGHKAGQAPPHSGPSSRPSTVPSTAPGSSTGTDSGMVVRSSTSLSKRSMSASQTSRGTPPRPASGLRRVPPPPRPQTQSTGCAIGSGRLTHSHSLTGGSPILSGGQLGNSILNDLLPSTGGLHSHTAPLFHLDTVLPAGECSTDMAEIPWTMGGTWTTASREVLGTPTRGGRRNGSYREPAAAISHSGGPSYGTFLEVPKGPSARLSHGPRSTSATSAARVYGCSFSSNASPYLTGGGSGKYPRAPSPTMAGPSSAYPEYLYCTSSRQNKQMRH